MRANGFMPGERVNVYVDDQLEEEVVALPTARSAAACRAATTKGERAFTLTVTEVEKPSNTATVSAA